jgi:hypothetical protein
MYTYSFRIYKGTSFSERFIWSENDIPVDLTGWDAQVQLKSTGNGEIISLSVDDGTIALGNNGEIDLALDPTATALLIPGSYAWDILLKNPNGIIIAPIVSGVATIIQGVTVWQ